MAKRELTKIENTFSNRLKPILLTFTEETPLAEIYSAVMDLVADKTISASDKYRKKVVFKIKYHFAKSNKTKMLLYLWNLIHAADGDKVIYV